MSAHSGKRDSKPASAISKAYMKYHSFLKRYLARFFSEQQDIDDVVQEAYLRAYLAEQRVQINQPKAYLFRIARNIALTELTKKSRQITSYIEDMDTSLVIECEARAGNEVEAEIEAQESLGLYCEAIASLPEKCRQVFLLRKVHGLAHKEIAARLSLSVSSVEKYLVKGILTCRALVEEREDRAVRQHEPDEDADMRKGGPR